jgi:hypothetical protein
MIALETIGTYSGIPGSQRYPPLFRYFFPDRADFIAFVSNFRSRKPMRRLAQAFQAATDFPLQHTSRHPPWFPGPPGAITCHSGASAIAP